MACSAGSINTGFSTPAINICTTVSGSNFTVNLEPRGTSSNPFAGYVKLIIEKESPTTDGWVRVSSPSIGYWANSNQTKSNPFTNAVNVGKTMRVSAEFYRYSDYTGKLVADASHIFYQG